MSSSHRTRMRNSMIERLLATGTTFTDDLDSTYKNCTTRVRVLCSECSKEIDQYPNNILRRFPVNCVECGNAKRAAMRTKSSAPKWFKRRFLGVNDRCNNPQSSSYHRYGGRGISLGFKTVDEMWDHMKSLPNCSPKLTIDRINNNKGYEAGNVRWATYTEQNRNQGAQANCVTGIPGVRVYKATGKYQSRITADRKERHLGFYDDFFLACCARKSAENKYWRS